MFPGYLSIEQGVTFESLGRDGYAAWDAVPDSGKAQILGVIGILEWLGEASVKPHYMMGGTPGKIPLLWDPLGFTKKLSPETLARKRTAELKNGCAAAPSIVCSGAHRLSRCVFGGWTRADVEAGSFDPPPLGGVSSSGVPSPLMLLSFCHSPRVRSRLAMIGVMSLVSAHFIPDSVPLLP